MKDTQQALYYKEARNTVVKFHKTNDRDVLRNKSVQLSGLARCEKGARKSRLISNARAIGYYNRNFANKDFRILKPLRLRLVYGPVEISVSPELHVIEKNKERVIKLEFSTQKNNEKLIPIINQLMLIAAQDNEIDLPSSAFQCFDVPKGIVHKKARAGSRIERELEAACENIVAIWEHI